MFRILETKMVVFTLCLAILLQFLINAHADELIEYRIPMPLDVNKYEIALRNTVVEMSLLGTGERIGIEVEEEGFSAPSKFWHLPSYYTKKKWHIARRAPSFIRGLVPIGDMELTEKAWNSYPITKTEYTNEEYMKEYFFMSIYTIYKEGDCTIENVYNLTGNRLARRIVQTLDFVNDKIDPQDYDPKYDPKLCMSSKTGKGKLKSNWRSTSQPMMCAYKLYTINFDWWGMVTKVQYVINKNAKRLLIDFNRHLFCTQDTWADMSMKELQAKEVAAIDELDEQRLYGPQPDIRIKF